MRLNKKEKPAFVRSCNLLLGGNRSRRIEFCAFTLVEVIVVISIISLLMSISLPVFTKVRQNARWIITMNDQREIVTALNAFAVNNNNSYPDSTATINFGGRKWTWQAPTLMTACEPRPGMFYRSMSSFLRPYIDNADILFCPSAPRKNEFLQEAWDAGEEWNNPLTNHPFDPFSGVYCFYWNYIGHMGRNQAPFRGPRGTYAGIGESTLLVSCYFGYDYYRSPKAFVSCEKFDGARISTGTEVSSDLWALGDPDVSIDVKSLNIRLHAGYADGHVQSYSPSETVKMDVSGTANGSHPYNAIPGLGPGVFYIPEKALPDSRYR